MKNHNILFEIKRWQLEQSRVALWLPQNVVEKSEIQLSVKYSALHFRLQRTKKKMLYACHHYIMKIQTYITTLSFMNSNKHQSRNLMQTYLKSELDEAKIDRNWFTEIPNWKSHQGTKNSNLWCFLLQACHCSIRKLLGTVSPPPVLQQKNNKKRRDKKIKKSTNLEQNLKYTWAGKPMINIPSKWWSRISMIIQNIAVMVNSNYCRIKASIPGIEEISWF